jgi:peptidoglycan/xylan/chitin deacetylase (PgdA/CDA1 family)
MIRPLLQIIQRGLDWIGARQRRLHHSSAVLLTFDDGPHPTITPAVLDRLCVYHARAAFFVVGNRIDRAPAVLSAILASGHYLGNHSFAHRLDRDPWLIAYYRDVVRCQRLLHERTGQWPRLFRAPMGRSSLGALLVPRILGLRHLLWTWEAQDWAVRDAKAAARCAAFLCSHVRPGDIILLHDDNPWILPILDILLPHLREHGFDLDPSL